MEGNIGGKQLKSENPSQKLSKVIDMMLTAHSSLRDKYNSYSLLMDLLLFGISIILNATVFLDPKILKLIGLNEDKTRIILGLISILVFIATFISLRVDWKQKGEQYRQTAETLSRLKSLLNENMEVNQDGNNSMTIIMHQVKEELDKLPVKIPEKKFIQLKARHKRKLH